ncbi:MAG: glycosyl hydrolase [Candidatus Aminicenantes bacterium]|nr:glycosyl hydrolase [Candidatus Aminicenantes bacterium]
MRTRNNTIRIVWAVCLIALLGAWATGAQDPGAALAPGFKNPPDSAKPRVWWHWMNGNITKDGIKADLEWMKRVGIGGFQNFDAALATPQVVAKRLVYMTPDWKDAFKFAATLADQLGLEMAIAGSPGWSETGGPWVTPAQAMKKLVWSETRLEGGKPFSGLLPKPPSTTGPFQNMPREGSGGGKSTPNPEYYGDSAVIAYRLPDGDIPMAELQPKVTSSGGSFSLASLIDGDLAKMIILPAAPAEQKAWIQFEFEKPLAVRGLSVAAEFQRRGSEGDQVVESSDDGLQFRLIQPIPDIGTIAFPPVTAKFFRLTFKTPAPPAGGGGAPAAATGTKIAEIVLYTGARVNRFEDKAGFSAASDLYALATLPVPVQDAVRKADVVDLTSKMRPNGRLDWTPPAGRWMVLRLGYSLTGARNSPASPEATGLEVDKLNRGHVEAYLNHYLGLYKETLGPLMGKRGLQYIITDSWEAGVQNWTDDMIAEFAKRRGYDPRPWLPVLTGRVVESAESSDRFLWDFRKTIGDLTTEYHYDQISASLHKMGMGRYTESHEGGRAFIGDGMEVKKNAEIPMSALWTPESSGDEPPGYGVDIRESASVAHIYGQNLVAAESLTAYGGNRGAWSWSPETLKPTADTELAMGLNRFVLHTSVHQPVSDKIPGLSLGPFGQWFTRHETWAELAKPWTGYLARSSYLLQQGRFVADILYFYGEDSNITALFGAKPPDIPAGYDFDFVNADAILHRLAAEGGRITTPSGMSYAVLALDANSRHMSLPVLRKIRDLVGAGAVVVGSKPVDAPSLNDDPAAFRAIADELWESGDGEHAFGKGRIFAGRTLAQVLAAGGIEPDFQYAKPRTDTNLRFVHRKLADGEIFWVNNRNKRAETLETSFRVQGKEAELWHPDTGEMEPASYLIANGRTIVPLRLDPYDAVFVVFLKPAAASARALPGASEMSLGTLEGPWSVDFQAERGAPARVMLEGLKSWSESADPGIKYFSGSATYTRTIQAPADWMKRGARLWLDLGNVKNLAEVSINGRPLGVLWKAPFRVDVTEAIKPGPNELKIKVTNLWVNRLIGDTQPGTTKKYTYTTQPFYRADSPLLPSGLLGPVRILRSAAE